MTTPLPAPDRRTLHAHDPAELLASLRLAFGEELVDAFVLVGHSGHGSQPVLTRSELHAVLADDGMGLALHQIDLLRDQGCTAAVALLVLGDGRMPLPPGVVAEAAAGLGPALLLAQTDALLDGTGLRLDPLWVIGDGVGHQVELLMDEEGLSVAVSPPQVLRDFEETDTAASAVLAGEVLAGGGPPEAELERIAARLQLGPSLLPPFGRTSDQRLDMLLERALRTLAGVREGSGGRRREPTVTDCELLEELLCALAMDSVHWELLGQFVDHGRSRRVDRDELLQVISTDPTLRPHRDVCAGGRRYELMESLRDIALAVAGAGGEEPRRLARAAWRGATVVLLLLAWWNHRRATAGRLADELWIQDPDSTLAPLLTRLIDTPIRPAWWPER